MQVLGHRGARNEAPENTLASIERALTAGVHGVEVDVRRTRDGRLVVIHDATVDRTTDGTGVVADLTFDEIRGLDAGQGERVPTLEEVLEAVRDRAELFVELKEPGCEEAVIQAIDAAGLRPSCLVKAFDHRLAARVKALAPDILTGCLIYARPVDPVGLVRAAGADALSLGIDHLDAELVAQCHAAGVSVCAWNCNDPAAAPGYAALGLDWLGTDVPTAVVAALR